jgi:hypothetical protein
MKWTLENVGIHSRLEEETGMSKYTQNVLGQIAPRRSGKPSRRPRQFPRPDLKDWI